MSLNEFNNFVHCSENWVLIPFFELEVLCLPDINDNLKFGFNLGFFSSSVNKLLNLLRESMELKLNEIFKSKLW